MCDGNDDLADSGDVIAVLPSQRERHHQLSSVCLSTETIATQHPQHDSQNWPQNFRATDETGGALGTKPTLAHGVFYAGSDDNHLYALDAQTGALIWSRPFPGVVNSNVAIAP
jgi:outer membrane protein assembly factor BamB